MSDYPLISSWSRRGPFRYEIHVEDREIRRTESVLVTTGHSVTVWARDHWHAAERVMAREGITTPPSWERP